MNTSNPECEGCPRVQDCRNIKLAGEHSVLAGADSSVIYGEYQNDDRTYTPASELFGQNDVLSPQRQQDLRDKGSLLIRIGSSSEEILKRECSQGPQGLEDGTITCSSTGQLEVAEALDTKTLARAMEALADNDVTIQIMRSLFPDGAGQ